MSTVTHYLFALFWAGALVWQLVSGKLLGNAWLRNITRQENPGTYWFMLAAQSAILIGFMVTAKAWFR